MVGMQIPIVSPEDMYKLDHSMIHKYGIPSSVLMENAAASVFQFLLQQFPELHREKIIIIAGPGKNGEDGLTLARQLIVKGVNVNVAILPPFEKLSVEYQQKVDILSNIGANIVGDIQNLTNYSIIIDAIFGIGLSRPPSGTYRDAIEKINTSNATVLSLDIPSGIEAMTGKVLDVAVFCDYCVSFGLLKRGNVINDGYTHCVGLFTSLLHAPYGQHALNTGGNLLLNVPEPLSRRDKTGYKNKFGRCLIVGGSNNYHGAPHFAASAFMKSGGGYLHLISTRDATNSLSVSSPESVLHPMLATEDGTLPSSSWAQIEVLGIDQDIVVVGPGLGISKDTNSILQQMMLSSNLARTPLLVDGDGLSLLSKNIELLSNRPPYTTILTPHLGEMSRLTGYSVTTISENPVEIAREFSCKWNVALLLKGPRSVIVTDKFTYINTSGTEALGTAGTGDVLDGIIAAFCTSQLGLMDGLRTAVFFHGFIGNLLSETGDSRSVTATDILQQIPHAINEYAARLNSLKEKRTPINLPGVRFLP